MIRLTCGRCGHENEFDAFCCTPISGQLPQNTFQCPTCHYAFERIMGPVTVHKSGWIQPGAISLVPVEPRL